MGLIISAMKGLWRALLLAVFITVIGQVTYKEDSLENRYHEFVNSSQFQTHFWVVMKPLTWTGERIQELWAQVRQDGPRSFGR